MRKFCSENRLKKKVGKKRVRFGTLGGIKGHESAGGTPRGVVLGSEERGVGGRGGKIIPFFSKDASKRRYPS